MEPSRTWPPPDSTYHYLQASGHPRCPKGRPERTLDLAAQDPARQTSCCSRIGGCVASTQGKAPRSLYPCLRVRWRPLRAGQLEAGLARRGSGAPLGRKQGRGQKVHTPARRSTFILFLGRGVATTSILAYLSPLITLAGARVWCCSRAGDHDLNFASWGRPFSFSRTCTWGCGR